MKGMWRNGLPCMLLAVFAVETAGQDIQILPARSMGKWGVVPGNYSGIAPLGSGLYAVADDKYPYEGFHVFRIAQDSVTGQVTGVVPEGFRGGGRRLAGGWDAEGIAFRATDSTVWISRESDQRIPAYAVDGQPDGRELAVPEGMTAKTIVPNYGFEALCYDAGRDAFWTLVENVLKADGETLSAGSREAACLRLQCFGADGKAGAQYAYRPELPVTMKKGRAYAFGAVALWAWPDGNLWVMEREIDVARRILKSKTYIHIYEICPTDADSLSVAERSPGKMGEKALEKRLVASFSTRMRLFRPKFANYEGMCEGISLRDGRRTLLLVSDSQNGYGNKLCHLRDRVRVLVLPR